MKTCAVAANDASAANVTQSAGVGALCKKAVAPATSAAVVTAA
jgi:hypothetical protein